jgi:hypothetical protein
VSPWTFVLVALRAALPAPAATVPPASQAPAGAATSTQAALSAADCFKQIICAWRSGIKQLGNKQAANQQMLHCCSTSWLIYEQTPTSAPRSLS